jgi:hypothetical protein
MLRLDSDGGNRSVGGCVCHVEGAVRARHRAWKVNDLSSGPVFDVSLGWRRTAYLRDGSGSGLSSSRRMLSRLSMSTIWSRRATLRRGRRRTSPRLPRNADVTGKTRNPELSMNVTPERSTTSGPCPSMATSRPRPSASDRAMSTSPESQTTPAGSIVTPNSGPPSAEGPGVSLRFLVCVKNHTVGRPRRRHRSVHDAPYPASGRQLPFVAIADGYSLGQHGRLGCRETASSSAACNRRVRSSS